MLYLFVNSSLLYVVIVLSFGISGTTVNVI